MTKSRMIVSSFIVLQSACPQRWNCTTLYMLSVDCNDTKIRVNTKVQKTLPSHIATKGYEDKWFPVNRTCCLQQLNKYMGCSHEATGWFPSYSLLQQKFSVGDKLSCPVLEGKLQRFSNTSNVDILTSCHTCWRFKAENTFSVWHAKHFLAIEESPATSIIAEARRRTHNNFHSRSLMHIMFSSNVSVKLMDCFLVSSFPSILGNCKVQLIINDERYFRIIVPMKTFIKTPAQLITLQCSESC